MPPSRNGPAYFILIAVHTEFEPCATSQEIVAALADRSIWLASRFTPFRREYKNGDRVLLYAAGRRAQVLMGDAVIAGEIGEATAEEKRLAEGLGLEGFAERLPLRDVRLWEKPLPLKPLVAELAFIKDKHNWGLNLRQAVARIPETDYQTILTEAGYASP